jgi:hypothetical protein
MQSSMPSLAPGSGGFSGHGRVEQSHRAMTFRAIRQQLPSAAWGQLQQFLQNKLFFCASEFRFSDAQSCVTTRRFYRVQLSP